MFLCFFQFFQCFLFFVFNFQCFLTFGNLGLISDAISHADFNRILYWYEKRSSNIVEFCSSCWKMAKNTPFHIKSPVKNFHGRANWGEASHRAPPLLNTPLLIITNTDNELLRNVNIDDLE